jgi:hypothetical protein
MSKGNTTENDFQKYTFNKTPMSWDALTQLFVSLHTGSPGETGDQTTSEANYTGYTRVAVQRQAGVWTVTDNEVKNASQIQFPQCAGLTNTITDVAIGTLFSGTGQVLYYGTLNSPLTVSNLIQPQFAINALTITED